MNTDKKLLGEKVAILIANGFYEADLTHIQRALQSAGANTRIVSMDHGLVNSWNGTGWGHHFAADMVLSAALAADFSMLVIPGGQRSVEKLKLTAHTRRFIRGFVDAEKPVAIMGQAAELLVFAERCEGIDVCSVDKSNEILLEAGASIKEEAIIVDKNILTAKDAENSDVVDQVLQHFVDGIYFEEAA